MYTIKKILVPTDFSKPSVIAYTHAQEIAKRFDARIDLIHIIPTMRYFNESLSKLGVPFDMESDLYPHAQQESRHKLKRVMKDNFPDDSRGEAIVKVGRKPWEGIVSHAKSEGYDLIVMASRGEHESDLLRGSVTEKVIRRSAVPVFAVDKRLSSSGLKRILVPTDASLVSFISLPVAVALAEVYDAEITLLHVIELHGSGMDSAVWDSNKSEEENVYETVIAGLQDYLKGQQGNEITEISLGRGPGNFEDQLVVSRGASSRSLTLKTVVERGVTAHAVIEEYAESNADVVVITTHGRSGLAHLLLGSTTEKVAQYLDLPVLTVKPREEKLKTRA